MTMHVLAKAKSPLSFITDSVLDLNAINFWLQKVNPLWSSNKALGKVVQKDTAAEGMVSLTIQVNRHFKFGQAGQHHPVFAVVDGIRYERTYSLTKLDAQHVLLTVKTLQGGKVSTWLAERAQTGDLVEFGAPFGDMVIHAMNQPLVLLAAGSGITPMLSLLKDMAKQNQLKDQPVHLMYWVKKQSDAAFVERFEKLASKHPAFSYQIFYTQEDVADSRLNASHVEQLTDVEKSTVYACGPSGFVSIAEQLFSHAQSFKSEAFSMSLMANDDIGFVNVTLTQSNKVLSIPKGQSILVALEQQNIKPKHGCRMGICNKCACNKAEGSTKNMVNGAQNTEPGNLLKICVNSAQSDLVIDL
jgi:ferredoxin-NADP reductase